jgi:hypothetical protein
MDGRSWTAIGVAAALSACAGAGGGGVAPTPAPRIPIPYTAGGLERVIGANAAGLARLFGQADADVREGPGRKLQFAGPICVLDAYLYPPKSGGEPVVSYLDAREPDGSAIDRASCVAALSRRPAAR